LRSKASVAIALTAVSALLWGTSFPVISLAISGGLSPFLFVFVRFAIAAPVMLTATALARRNVTRLLASREVWALGFLNAVGFLCQFVGQKYTAASVAALLINLSVVMAAVGGAVFLRERIGRLGVVGVALALAGTAMVATGGDLASLSGGKLLGDTLYLVAAVVWAGYIVYAKKKTDERSLDPLSFASCIVAATAIFLIPAALVSWPSAPVSVASWEAIGYTVVFNTALPFVLYQAGLRHITASLSAVVLMLEILVAVLISVIFLGETFTVISGAGAVAVLASILMVSRPEVRRELIRRRKGA
jgi:drug/metabolite transporter (DMT)-like permease